MTVTLSVGISPWTAIVGILVIGVGVTLGITMAEVVKENGEDIAKQAASLFS